MVYFTILYIWNEIKAIMCKTRILKIPENSLDFRSLAMLSTQTETFSVLERLTELWQL